MATIHRRRSDQAIFYDTCGNDTYNASGNTSSLTSEGSWIRPQDLRRITPFFRRNRHGQSARRNRASNYVYGNGPTR